MQHLNPANFCKSLYLIHQEFEKYSFSWFEIISTPLISILFISFCTGICNMSGQNGIDEKVI